MRALYRGRNEFKEDRKHRINIITFENGDLLANSHNISTWKN
jgi:hypothetical protein